MSVKRGVRRSWTKDAEECFIDLWANKMPDFCNEKKSVVYRTMSRELFDSGIELSPMEVKAKISNMVAKYRRCLKDKDSRVDWPLFTKIERIVGKDEDPLLYAIGTAATSESSQEMVKQEIPETDRKQRSKEHRLEERTQKTIVQTKNSRRDEDEAFFMSLLSHVCKLSPQQKLKYRTDVLNLTHEYVYGPVKRDTSTADLQSISDEDALSCSSSFLPYTD